MTSTEDRKTPLYEAHKGLNAKIVSFHGWLLPIQYTSIIEEHNATRTKAGLFDISHLGKLEVSGKSSKEFLQKIFTNNIEKALPGGIVYSPLCNDNGGTLDDAFIYNAGKDRYILIVNASTFEKDLAWIRSHKTEGVDIKDINDSLGGIAIQGPASQQILSHFCKAYIDQLKHRHFVETEVYGSYALLSRSGYTGEDGFEMFIPAGKCIKVWNDILASGKGYGLIPAGLGSRDTLRLEAGCPLYGVDTDESKTPLESGLERTLDLSKDFIGKKAILERKAKGIKEVLVGFKMLDKAIPRTGYAIEKGGKSAGIVTSGTYSPTLKENIGFAYVAPEDSKTGGTFDVIVHGEKKKAVVVETPFYRRAKN
ncbi:MAG: glycine cleavage system aminomethyltransferase GcvT [Candidatus Omnitrophica bacterium]|nr:glycine cleavage system aminomethyltransferase GcvT [Candidatus Omnitrophota bacterium]